MRRPRTGRFLFTLVLHGLCGFTLCSLCTVSPPAFGQEKEEQIQALIHLLEERLEALPATQTPPLQVRLADERLRVPYGKDTVSLPIHVQNARDLAIFMATVECDSNLRMATPTIVPGPLWNRLAGVAGLSDPPPMGAKIGREATGCDIWGMGILDLGQGIYGDGMLAELRFQVISPGSAQVRLKNFTWFPAGPPRRVNKASVVGSARIDIYTEKESAYLSLEKPQEDLQLTGLANHQVQAGPGEVFLVHLGVTNLYQVLGVTFSLEYDQEHLELLRIEEGDLFSEVQPTLTCFDFPSVANKTGKLPDQGIALLGPGPGLRRGGEVVRFLFRATGRGTGQVRLLSLEIETEGDGKRQPVSVLEEGKTVNVNP